MKAEGIARRTYASLSLYLDKLTSKILIKCYLISYGKIKHTMLKRL